MTIKEAYTKVKKGLESGIYKTVRLVQVTPEGGEDILFPYNKLSDVEKAKAKLEHFKKVLETDLPPGKYKIQAKSLFINSKVSEFPIEITEKKPIPISENAGTSNHNPQPEQFHEHEPLEEEFMDNEEYKKMLNTISDLKTQVHMLELERDWYKKVASMENKQQALNDSAGGWTAMADVLKDAIPGVVNLAEKFFEDRKESRQKQLSDQQGKVRIERKTHTIPKVMSDEEIQQQTIDYFDKLFQSDEERANEELDQLEQSDIDMYNVVCEALGLLEDPEQDKEEQTGT